MIGKFNLQYRPLDEGEERNLGRWFGFYTFCFVALSVGPALHWVFIQCDAFPGLVLTDENATRIFLYFIANDRLSYKFSSTLYKS